MSEHSRYFQRSNTFRGYPNVFSTSHSNRVSVLLAPASNLFQRICNSLQLCLENSQLPFSEVRTITSRNLQNQVCAICFLSSYGLSIFSYWFRKRSCRACAVWIAIPAKRYKTNTVIKLSHFHNLEYLFSFKTGE